MISKELQTKIMNFLDEAWGDKVFMHNTGRIGLMPDPIYYERLDQTSPDYTPPSQEVADYTEQQIAK